MIILLTPKKSEIVKTDLVLPTPKISNPFIGQNVSAQFSYPSNVSVETQPIEPAGESDTVNIAPEVIIETQKIPYSPQALQKMTGLIDGFNLNKSDVTVGAQNISAVQYKGVMELDKPYQQVITIFVVGDTIYKVQLLYFAQAASPEYEAEYQKILSSVEVK